MISVFNDLIISHTWFCEDGITVEKEQQSDQIDIQSVKTTYEDNK